MESQDKWLMFKNYMHNELGITKDDIRAWIKEAVKEEAERLVRNEREHFDIQDIVVRLLRSSLSDYNFRNALIRVISNKLNISINLDK